MNRKPAALRQVLSRFATGVTVVTSIDQEGNPLGVTVNSFISVSLDPPLVLWCLGDQTWGLKGFLKARYFIINVLTDKQKSISDTFAAPGEFNRFKKIRYCCGRKNIPLIADCCASLECTLYKLQREGDHWLFICDVKSWQSSDGQPLLFFGSDYRYLKNRARF